MMVARLLFALPVVLGLCALVVTRFYQVQTSVNLLASQVHLQTLLQGFSTARHRMRLVLMLFGATSLLITFLQPQWGMQEQLVSRQGRDVVIALDISRSMQAADVKPTRLMQAKMKISQLVEKLAADRVGLILFSGSAMVQCPLTADHTAFKMFLDSVDVESFSSGTTAIDKALAAALGCYANQQGRSSKLVVLVTDGEDFSRNFSHAKAQAAQEGIKIAALGIGTEQGAPIPKFNYYGQQIGHEVGEDGKPAVTKLNSALLSSLASELAGVYTQDVQQIAAFIEQHDREHIDELELEQHQQRYPWFAAASALLLGLEFIL